MRPISKHTYHVRDFVLPRNPAPKVGLHFAVLLAENMISYKTRINQPIISISDIYNVNWIDIHNFQKKQNQFLSSRIWQVPIKIVLILLNNKQQIGWKKRAYSFSFCSKRGAAARGARKSKTTASPTPRTNFAMSSWIRLPFTSSTLWISSHWKFNRKMITNQRGWRMNSHNCHVSPLLQ